MLNFHIIINNTKRCLRTKVHVYFSPLYYIYHAIILPATYTCLFRMYFDFTDEMYEVYMSLTIRQNWTLTKHFQAYHWITRLRVDMLLFSLHFFIAQLVHKYSLD